jgi:hypothetical protein
VDAIRPHIPEPQPFSTQPELVHTISNIIADFLLLTEEINEDAIDFEFVINDQAFEAIRVAADRVADFFVRSIRYLGPLRLEPFASQSFSPSGEPDDVGPKGEFAAAVYDAYRDRPVRWWNPFEKREALSSLQQALDTWVNYIGVADSVRVRDAGLAPENALLLIEQPELHLHPRAQNRLAEFFGGLCKTGRRCVIETHSEAMINGFRLILVQQAAATDKEIAIYFAQQTAVGDSSFQEVRIGEDGLIQNWPEGFFDESYLIEDRITSEAIRKRA